MPEMTCSGCQKVQTVRATPKGERVPRGWQRLAASVYCGECWTKRYRLRAVTFPVAEVLGDVPWSEFTDALKQCWGLSTSLANWAVTELAKADTVRTPDQHKLAVMP